MSGATFTPGPWSVELADRYVVGPDGLSVADYERGRPEDNANARLIAAAPDLLAALKMVVSQIEDYYPGRKHCWDCVAQALEVIAKAEGHPLPDREPARLVSKDEGQ